MGKSVAVDKKTGEVRRGVIFFEPDSSMTVQSQKDACDVNKIMAQYQKTGVLTHSVQREGIYADVSAVGDFQSSLRTVALVRSQFAALPSSVRDRFLNSPEALMNFMTSQKPEDVEESYELGLRVRPKASPDKPTPTNPTPPAAPAAVPASES